jgi:hypothetical protein
VSGPDPRPGPRAFVLVRHVDVSGVSGTGVVAEGTVWSDGSASVRWPGRGPGTGLGGRSGSVAFWPDGVGEVEATHGHGGATEVRYLDHPDAAAVAVAPAGLATPGDHEDVGGFCSCCGCVTPCSTMSVSDRPGRRSGAGDGLEARPR